MPRGVPARGTTAKTSSAPPAPSERASWAAAPGRRDGATSPTYRSGRRSPAAAAIRVRAAVAPQRIRSIRSAMSIATFLPRRAGCRPFSIEAEQRRGQRTRSRPPLGRDLRLSPDLSGSRFYGGVVKENPMTTAARNPRGRLGGRPGDRDAWLRTVALGAGAAVIYYIGFTALGSALVPGYSQLSQPAGALAGADSPYRIVFAAGYTLYGLALAVTGVALQRTCNRGPSNRVASGLLVGAGAAEVLAVTLLPAGSAGAAATVHSALAALAAAGCALAPLVWALAWWHDDGWRTVSMFGLLAGVATAALWLMGVSAGPGFFGLVERSAQAVFLTWLVVTAARALRMTGHASAH